MSKQDLSWLMPAVSSLSFALILSACNKEETNSGGAAVSGNESAAMNVADKMGDREFQAEQGDKVRASEERKEKMRLEAAKAQQAQDFLGKQEANESSVKIAEIQANSAENIAGAQAEGQKSGQLFGMAGNIGAAVIGGMSQTNAAEAASKGQLAMADRQAQAQEKMSADRLAADKARYDADRGARKDERREGKEDKAEEASMKQLRSVLADIADQRKLQPPVGRREEREREIQAGLLNVDQYGNTTRGSNWTPALGSAIKGANAQHPISGEVTPEAYADISEARYQSAFSAFAAANPGISPESYAAASADIATRVAEQMSNDIDTHFSGNIVGAAKARNAISEKIAAIQHPAVPAVVQAAPPPTPRPDGVVIRPVENEADVFACLGNMECKNQEFPTRAKIDVIFVELKDRANLHEDPVRVAELNSSLDRKLAELMAGANKATDAEIKQKFINTHNVLMALRNEDPKAAGAFADYAALAKAKYSVGVFKDPIVKIRASQQQQASATGVGGLFDSASGGTALVAAYPYGSSGVDSTFSPHFGSGQSLDGGTPINLQGTTL